MKSSTIDRALIAMGGCEEVLQPFLDRDLTDAERRDAQQHLDDCKYCRKRYRFEQGLRRLVRQATVEPIDLREWTDGRLASNFRYVGNGTAFANVLHHETFGVSSPEELSAEALENLWASGPHWKLWLFDVAGGTGQPVQGIEVAIADGAQFAVLDGRTFVFLPYDDWGRTTAYELMSDSSVIEHFGTVGDVFKWVRVR